MSATAPASCPPMTSMPPTAREAEAEQESGRRLSVTAYGDTALEIEQAATEEARAFFGPHARLEVDDYQAVPVTASNGLAAVAGGKRYCAYLHVRWCRGD